MLRVTWNASTSFLRNVTTEPIDIITLATDNSPLRPICDTREILLAQKYSIILRVAVIINNRAHFSEECSIVQFPLILFRRYMEMASRARNRCALIRRESTNLRMMAIEIDSWLVDSCCDNNAKRACIQSDMCAPYKSLHLHRVQHAQRGLFTGTR